MLRRIWFSEDSTIGRRTKQFVAFVVPRPLLVAAKKRYYLALLENPRTPREADMEALNQIVRPGDFALDIGAFVGFYTQRLSQLAGATGEVWAFEPVPETFSMLSYAVRELSLNNVRVLNLALSDSDDEAVMEIPKYRYGGECLYSARIVSTRSRPDLRVIPIQAQTLDSMLSRGDASRRTVRFMKLDVEYHELHTIRGAIATIRRDHPVILMELLRTADPANSRSKLLNMLAVQGYKAFRRADGKFVSCAPDEDCQNRFFLTQTHVAEFAQYVRWD
jgi:FkbM family methyltransferase